MVWISFISTTEKLTGQCAVLQRNKRFIYYLVKKNPKLNPHFSPIYFSWQTRISLNSCSMRCFAGHKEEGEPQAELRQPETEPGGHEVALRAGRSDQSVHAAVRVLSGGNVAAPLPPTYPFSSPQPYDLLVFRAALAAAWIDCTGTECQRFWKRCLGARTSPSPSTVFPREPRPP